MSTKKTRWYIDTSAAFKLLRGEAETEYLQDMLDGAQPYLVSCDLLETELRRAAFNGSVPQKEASSLIEEIDLYAVPRSVFHDAGLLQTPGLRSLDAIHLASAKRLQVDVILTYDDRMARGANDLGYLVISPGV